MTSKTAIVTSRLPRLIDPAGSWLSALRGALRRVKRNGDCLITIGKTAGAEIVRRAAVRLNIEVEEIQEFGVAADSTDESIPCRDRSLVLAAETVLVLGLRTNGNIHQLLRERVLAARPVVLVDLPGLQSRSARDELTSLGASCWVPDASDQIPLGTEGVESTEQAWDQSNQIIEIVPFPPAEEWMFLSHSTRACAGPWPDESVEDYIDSLLNGDADADHSPVSTLRRIVRQQRLIASGRVIRGGYSVVCFTALPLQYLPSLRQFQNHRTRWDFEPFGICIRRDWLEELGTRPVIYGTEETWSQLSDADRPWFQLSGNADSTHSDVTDWSYEQEWRHVGDVDLNSLPSNAAIVFVPNFAAAQQIVPVSRWPITLWPATDTPLDHE